MPGSCDFVPWAVTREHRDTLPNAELVSVPNAGHGIAADQPDLYERPPDGVPHRATAAGTPVHRAPGAPGHRAVRGVTPMSWW